MLKKLTYSSALLAIIFSFFSTTLTAQQLPLYVNIGSTSTCDDFDRGVAVSGNVPLNSPTLHGGTFNSNVNLVSGDSLQIYAPISHMTQNRPNACMYGSEIFAEGDNDLVLTYCDLNPGQQVLLTLYFEEIYQGIQAAGVRQFDINVQGQTVVQNFDIWDEANVLNNGNGGNNVPVEKSFNAFADLNGCVQVVLADVGLNNPKINGVSLHEPTAFPVEFLSFDAKANAFGTVNLQWETATELNNSGFEIQFSEDGKAFTKAGFVKGVGNSQQIQSYSYSIENLPAKSYLFRLKQIDIDGSYSFSQGVELTLKDDQGWVLGDLYPNPTATQASVALKVAQTQNVIAEVIDLRGAVIEKVFEGSVRGNTTLELHVNLEQQASGLYLLRVKGKSELMTRKILRK